jgi:hypothetical protein
MMPHSTTHLSAEAFDDILIGMGSREAEDHLAECAACREKLDAFREDMSLFNEASLGWTEARTVKPRTVARRRAFFVPSPVLGLGALAMLLVMLGLPTVHRPNTGSVPHTPAVSDTSGSAEQIAADNQLMKDVDAAINPDEASVVDQYHLMESPKSH